MSRRNWDLPWDDYLATLKPHERPALPGSPATPDHSTPWRLAYACVGVLVALTGSLGNAAVTANIPLLAGSLGVTTTEASWLPVVFVMTNACMNLLLVKFRMQYGLRLFTEIILMIFLATATAHLFLEDYGSTLVVRGIAGIGNVSASAATPAASIASDVRIHARKVRSFASEKRGSGSSPTP